MDIPFLTLQRYDGQVLPIASQAGDDAVTGRYLTWELDTAVPGWLDDAVAPVFAKRGDRLRDVYRLQFADISGLGNQLYRLDGDREQLFLKILGTADGNNRELLVWNILGFDGKQKPYIRGLPPADRVVVDHDLRAILTPYFPGVLRALGGASYEFPLVLSLVLYLEDTLRNLHEAGLVYMDLCPANILYQTARSGALLFYLTDMGGVKPQVGHPPTPLFERLLAEVTPRRWTRREALPPGNMFPHHEADERLEARVEYDLYSLAQVARLLLGLAGDSEQQLAEGYAEQFSLEHLLRPKRDEIQRLQSTLKPWLGGSSQTSGDRDAVRGQIWSLFEDYFLQRVAFAADYLDEPVQRERWRRALADRLNRYRMADSRSVADLEKACAARWEEPAAGGFAAEIVHLESLADSLLSGAPQRTLEALSALAQSRLVQQSQTANYAFFHHQKCLRALYGSNQAIRDGLTRLAGVVQPAAPMDEEPERATLRAVRREGAAAILGVLRRQLQVDPC